MMKKIELIENDNGWSWFILKWSGSGWYNADTGWEATYEEAAAAAKEAYGV